RRAVLEASVPRGLAVRAAGMGRAIQAVNALCPEHLELHVEDPEAALDQIRGAGAVFVGAATPTALGGYVAGPNPKLPTGGTAPFASALAAAAFVRVTWVIEVEKRGAGPLAAAAAKLARAEGLAGHAATLDEMAKPLAGRKRT